MRAHYGFCFFLLTNDVEHFLMCLLSICMSSSVKCQSVIHIFIELFGFVSELREFLIYSGSACSDMCIVTVLYQFVVLSISFLS